MQEEKSILNTEILVKIQSAKFKQLCEWGGKKKKRKARDGLFQVELITFSLPAELLF